MTIDEIELIGWTATVLLLIGYYLNAKKVLASWIVWAIGNTLMLVYSLLIDSHSIATLSCVLIGLNIYGFISWKKHKQ